VELQAIGELRTDNDIEQIDHILDRFGHWSNRIKRKSDRHDAFPGDKAMSP
jgi:hypothetical protein